MGVRSATHRDISEEVERVKRHIDQAVCELTAARGRMSAGALQGTGERSTSELASLCISLELALGDSIASARQLAERMTRGPIGRPVLS